MGKRLTKRTAEGISVKENYGENAPENIYRCFGEEASPDYSNCDEGYCAMEKLARYEDLEESGHMVILPISVGENYYTVERGETGKKYVREWTAKTEEFCMNAAFVLGKTIFLTKKEAKNAAEKIEWAGP